MNRKPFVVAGIDTDAGKTLASAIICLGSGASYWKPIQAGREPLTDSEQIRKWTGISAEKILPEAFVLTNPMSPNLAAATDGIRISAKDLIIPETAGPLIIEPAGGLMVPVNETELFVDVLAEWKIPVILVVRTYLGCINHTLLSVEALRSRSIPIAGIVFNEGGRPESESVIISRTGLQVLGRIPQLEKIDPESLRKVWMEGFEMKGVLSWES